jgi:hypothetical protein
MEQEGARSYAADRGNEFVLRNWSNEVIKACLLNDENHAR